MLQLTYHFVADGHKSPGSVPWGYHILTLPRPPFTARKSIVRHNHYTSQAGELMQFTVPAVLPEVVLECHMIGLSRVQFSCWFSKLLPVRRPLCT